MVLLYYFTYIDDSWSTQTKFILHYLATVQHESSWKNLAFILNTVVKNKVSFYSVHDVCTVVFSSKCF